VSPETGFCPAHAPGGRERLLKAARKGGEATARKLARQGLGDEELPPLGSPQAAELWLEVVGRAVASGRLGHHEGRTITGAVREWLKARDVGEHADRLEELEAKLRAFRRGELEVVK
jgi:hypothetical protein